MKTKITLLAILFCVLGYAQNGINYMAVIKDNLGNVVANQSVNIRFTILKGATNVYQETHLTMTDANGIAIVNIGEGTTVSGSFSTIDWGSTQHSLKVEIDIAGGTTYENIGTTEFKAVPYALNVTGLESLNEGNGIGWRLKGRDSTLYGNIGFNAIDFSRRDYYDNKGGATGAYSLARGIDVEANGDFATAIGFFTRAANTYSTAIGYLANASGENATAIGKEAQASGDFSTSMGLQNTAAGRSSAAIGSASYAQEDYSTAIGYFTRASGKYSTAIGKGTYAKAISSVALGAYNFGFGDDDPNRGTNPILEIGNGANNTERSNALTVLKNGNVGIGNLTPASLLEVSHLDGTLSTTNIKNAFSIKNAGSLKSWQFHVNTAGALVLYRNGTYTSYFHEGTGAYVTVSDRRLKKEILPLETNTIQKLLKLNPVSYQMIGQENDERQIGLISQEVQEIFPSLTHLVPGQDILSLSYTELIPILIKAIQEQQEIIQKQDSKIEDISAELTEFKSLVQRVKTLEMANEKTNN